MIPNAARDDPYSAFNYLVEIGGCVVAGFSEAGGLDMDTDVRKGPGIKKFTRIVLKRGYTKDRAPWEWWRNVMDGKIERRSGSIVLLNEAGERAIEWSFREAWPLKWEGPELNAKTNEVAIETLEICAESLSFA